MVTGTTTGMSVTVVNSAPELDEPMVMGRTIEPDSEIARVVVKPAYDQSNVW